VEDDISAYEYSNIRVRKCSALSHYYSVLELISYSMMSGTPAPTLG
jgi:hypothetical protein